MKISTPRKIGVDKTSSNKETLTAKVVSTLTNCTASAVKKRMEMPSVSHYGREYGRRAMKSWENRGVMLDKFVKTNTMSNDSYSR